jgi:hypothetical protein
MIEQQLEAMVGQPPERTFDFSLDLPNEPAWNPERLKVEKTSDEPLGLGTTFTGKMRRVGQIKAEILAVERPNSFSTVERSRAPSGRSTSASRRTTAGRASRSRCGYGPAVRRGCSSR